MTNPVLQKRGVLEFGNEILIAGVLFRGLDEEHTILFPESEFDKPKTELRYQLNTEDWKELLYQLDTLGVEGLNKTILRKSQRQIESTVQWNVFRRDNYACQYCARNDVPLTVDHIVLWEAMGDSVEGNLICACKKCNKTRGRTEFLAWLKSDYLQQKILGFGALAEISAQMDKLEQMHQGAVKLPLRRTERSR